MTEPLESPSPRRQVARVRLELTEEERDNLESLLEVLSFGQALLFQNGKDIAWKLRELVLAAPLVPVPDPEEKETPCD